MAVKRIDEYEHNNPNLSIVDNTNVRGATKIVADQAAMLALPVDKLKEGTKVMYRVNDEFVTWQLLNITGSGNINNWRQILTASQTDLSSKVGVDQLGVADGVATLDESGRVPTNQLPSYVDDVLEFSGTTDFPLTGETSKIYIALDTDLTYRWGGTVYTEISKSLALGEVAEAAFRGDLGKIAYDHSLIVSGNPHNVTKTEINLGNVDNTSDLAKPVSSAQTAVFNTKLDTGSYTGTAETLKNEHDSEIAQISLDYINAVGINVQPWREGLSINNVDNTSDIAKPVSSAQTESILSATLSAITSSTGYTDTRMSNVLEKDNTTTFSPSNDYQPATKKYVDDNIVSGTSLSLSATSFVVALSDGKTLGKYGNGDTVPGFPTIQEQLIDIGRETINPTYVTSVSFSLDVSGSSLRVIGSTTSTNLTFNFNKGRINGLLVNGIWESGTKQANIAGDEVINGYTLNGTAQDSNILNVTGITVTQGVNSYSGTVTYNTGPQPLNSIGGNFGTPYPAGTSPVRTDSFEGVYPIYASTSVITTPTPQSLVSMINGDNLIYTLVTEEGVNKQFFEIPEVWLNDRPLTSILFFNTVAGAFDPAEQINTFTTELSTRTIEGQVVNYTKYTNNTSNRGVTQIKLIF